MKTFTRDYRMYFDLQGEFGTYLKDMKPCVLDIETTGFSADTARICLIALLTGTDSGIRVTQFLAEDHYEEDRVLRAAMDFISNEKIDYLITFNGQSFDVPFINRRLEALFMPDQLMIYDFDLYRFLRRSTDIRERIGSLKQKALEDYYGILSDRQDEISGRESVSLFNEYTLTGNPLIEKIILTHNREDVIQLERLMHLSTGECSDVHEAFARYGFPAGSGRLSVRVHLLKQKMLLQVTGDQFQAPVSADYYPDAEENASVHFNAAARSYDIDVPVMQHDNHYYIDARACRIGHNDDIIHDPDHVNGYLILSSRTMNLAGKALAERALERIRMDGYDSFNK